MIANINMDEGACYMFINRLNQLYKPNRILYYTDAPEQDIEAAYHGILPEDISRYCGDFGTYDYPGVFFCKTMGKAVIGIEYRADDDAHRNYSDLSIMEDPGIIAIFSEEDENKLRLLYEWKVDVDRAKLIMEDRADCALF